MINKISEYREKFSKPNFETTIEDINIDTTTRSTSRGHILWNSGYKGFKGVVPKPTMVLGIEEYKSNADPSENVHFFPDSHPGYVGVL